FVVGRLAARQHISVSLRPSPYGGTTAIILIPAELVVDTTAPPEGDGDAAAETGERAERLVPAAAAAGAGGVNGASGAAPASLGEGAAADGTAERAGEADAAHGQDPAKGPIAPGDPPGPSVPSTATGTGPGGLPRRVPEANLAPRLRDAAKLRTEARRAEPRADGRNGETHRDVLSSFQAGWRRAGEDRGDSRWRTARSAGANRNAGRCAARPRAAT